MDHADCQVLFEAGKALIEESGLAQYYDSHFVACQSKEGFDEYWKEELHPKFGRYIAWILFSVGAENLAKAACVCNGVVKISSKPSLEHYVKKHFRKLCRKTRLCDGDSEDILIEGYKYLIKVRNRDAHSYRENVRDGNYSLMEGTFVPALNVVAVAMRRGGHHA